MHVRQPGNLIADIYRRDRFQVGVRDTIGSVGDSAGCESAQESHLHLSVAASGQSVSPLDYLPQKN